MYDHLRAHGEVEAEILNEYSRLAEDEESSAAFGYLARLILEDEVRHHRVFEELAEAIRQMGAVQRQDEPIPSIRGLRADRDRILDLTERLLDVERADAKELDRLLKEFKPYRDTTMWTLLIDLMRDDTSKHIKILQFVRDRAKDS
jgi:hypothetical protein